jgi:hypothetical protein
MQPYGDGDSDVSTSSLNSTSSSEDEQEDEEVMQGQEGGSPTRRKKRSRPDATEERRRKKERLEKVEGGRQAGREGGREALVPSLEGARVIPVSCWPTHTLFPYCMLSYRWQLVHRGVRRLCRQVLSISAQLATCNTVHAGLSFLLA